MNTSHGGTLWRRIFNFALVSILAAILLTLASPTTTIAAEASWTGANSLSYDNMSFVGPADDQTIVDLKLQDGTQAYTYVEQTSNQQSKMHVIYFSPESDSSVATGAKYRTYVYQGPGSYQEPTSPIDITIANPESSAGTSSCDGLNGIGWIVCPITNFLASGMDWIFDILSGFLAVRPIEAGQTDTPLYRAWSYMLGIANIAFVIVFLIIIYSQLTSVGISNYGIKKLLPRLIIGALLVNLSYLICAIAVDISNILGYSLQNIFIEMRNGLVGGEGNGWDVLSWESVAGFVLSGGTLISAGLVGTLTTVATYGVAGSIFLLLPALMIGLMAVLIALLIMAARQAIITILVVIAPLAFVAYLLPNTEKWFDKWRGLFMTMLILFPAFSLVFGGSQLAAMIIIQNADSFNLIILGMLVQVAPLFITPLLLKLSGSLLTRIAGIVNNPNKGLIDRTRNFAKDRADNHAARRLATPATRGQFLKRYAQHSDHQKRAREGWRNAHTSMADARWAGSEDHHSIDQAVRESADRKGLGEAISENRYNTSKVRNAKIQRLDVELRNAKLDVENSSSAADVQYANLKAEPSALNVIPSHLATQALHARRAEQQKAVLSYQEHSAKLMQQTELAAQLRDNTAMRNLAGGIDPSGAQRALAAATKVISEAHAETIKNMRTIIDRANLSGDKLRELALGNNQVGSDGRIIEATNDAVEAAIGMVVDSGNVTSIINLSENLDLSPAANEDHRLAFVEALRRQSGRPKYLGAGWLDAVTQGVPGGVGAAGVDQAIVGAINDKKLSADVLVSQDKDVINRVLQSIETQGTLAFDQSSLETFKKQIIEAYRTDAYKGRVAERDDGLRGIINLLDRSGVEYDNESTERSETNL